MVDFMCFLIHFQEIRLFELLRRIKEPITYRISTTSSEAVFPNW